MNSMEKFKELYDDLKDAADRIEFATGKRPNKIILDKELIDHMINDLGENQYYYLMRILGLDIRPKGE
jgi:hypothetical protein